VSKNKVGSNVQGPNKNSFKPFNEPALSRAKGSTANYDRGSFQSFKTFNRCAPFKTFKGLGR